MSVAFVWETWTTTVHRHPLADECGGWVRDMDDYRSSSSIGRWVWRLGERHGRLPSIVIHWQTSVAFVWETWTTTVHCHPLADECGVCVRDMDDYRSSSSIGRWVWRLDERHGRLPFIVIYWQVSVAFGWETWTTTVHCHPLADECGVCVRDMDNYRSSSSIGRWVWRLGERHGRLPFIVIHWQMSVAFVWETWTTTVHRHPLAGECGVCVTDIDDYRSSPSIGRWVWRLGERHGRLPFIVIHWQVSVAFVWQTWTTTVHRHPLAGECGVCVRDMDDYRSSSSIGRWVWRLCERHGRLPFIVIHWQVSVAGGWETWTTTVHRHPLADECGGWVRDMDDYRSSSSIGRWVWRLGERHGRLPFIVIHWQMSVAGGWETWTTTVHRHPLADECGGWVRDMDDYRSSSSIGRWVWRLGERHGRLPFIIIHWQMSVAFVWETWTTTVHCHPLADECGVCVRDMDDYRSSSSIGRWVWRLGERHGRLPFIVIHWQMSVAVGWETWTTTVHRHPLADECGVCVRDMDDYRSLSSIGRWLWRLCERHGRLPFIVIHWQVNVAFGWETWTTTVHCHPLAGECGVCVTDMDDYRSSPSIGRWVWRLCERHGRLPLIVIHWQVSVAFVWETWTTTVHRHPLAGECGGWVRDMDDYRSSSSIGRWVWRLGERHGRLPFIVIHWQMSVAVGWETWTTTVHRHPLADECGGWVRDMDDYRSSSSIGRWVWRVGERHGRLPFIVIHWQMSVAVGWETWTTTVHHHPLADECGVCVRDMDDYRSLSSIGRWVWRLCERHGRLPFIVIHWQMSVAVGWETWKTTVHRHPLADECGGWVRDMDDYRSSSSIGRWVWRLCERHGRLPFIVIHWQMIVAFVWETWTTTVHRHPLAGECGVWVRDMDDYRSSSSIGRWVWRLGERHGRLPFIVIHWQVSVAFGWETWTTTVHCHPLADECGVCVRDMDNYRSSSSIGRWVWRLGERHGRLPFIVIHWQMSVAFVWETWTTTVHCHPLADECGVCVRDMDDYRSSSSIGRWVWRLCDRHRWLPFIAIHWQVSVAIGWETWTTTVHRHPLAGECGVCVTDMDDYRSSSSIGRWVWRLCERHGRLPFIVIHWQVSVAFVWETWTTTVHRHPLAGECGVCVRDMDDYRSSSSIGRWVWRLCERHGRLPFIVIHWQMSVAFVWETWTTTVHRHPLAGECGVCVTDIDDYRSSPSIGRWVWRLGERHGRLPFIVIHWQVSVAFVWQTWTTTVHRHPLAGECGVCVRDMDDYRSSSSIGRWVWRLCERHGRLPFIVIHWQVSVAFVWETWTTTVHRHPLAGECGVCVRDMDDYRSSSSIGECGVCVGDMDDYRSSPSIGRWVWRLCGRHGRLPFIVIHWQVSVAFVWETWTTTVHRHPLAGECGVCVRDKDDYRSLSSIGRWVWRLCERHGRLPFIVIHWQVSVAFGWETWTTTVHYHPLAGEGRVCVRHMDEYRSSSYIGRWVWRLCERHGRLPFIVIHWQVSVAFGWETWTTTVHCHPLAGEGRVCVRDMDDYRSSSSIGRWVWRLCERHGRLPFIVIHWQVSMTYACLRKDMDICRPTTIADEWIWYNCVGMKHTWKGVCTGDAMFYSEHSIFAQMKWRTNCSHITAVTYYCVHCGSNLESRVCITLFYLTITLLEFCMVCLWDAAQVACLLVLG